MQEDPPGPYGLWSTFRFAGNAERLVRFDRPDPDTPHTRRISLAAQLGLDFLPTGSNPPSRSRLPPR